MIERIRYKSGYRYQLAETYYIFTGIKIPCEIVEPFICMSRAGGLYISAGYAWDGATCFPDIPSIMRASLVHDALYQLLRLGHLPPDVRPAADALMYRCCVEDDMFQPLAWAVLKTVRLAGSPAADPRNAKPLLEAP